MQVDRRIESLPTITPLTYGEVTRRASEYKSLHETGEDAARWMVYRMYYFISLASESGMRGSVGLRATIRDGELDDATKLAQYLYEKEYLFWYQGEPPTILDRLIPTAREFARMPGFERHYKLKMRIGRGRMMLQPVSELVAEKDLMKMRSWQEQVANITRKLSEGVENPRKIRRMEDARYYLERKIQLFY